MLAAIGRPPANVVPRGPPPLAETIALNVAYSMYVASGFIRTVFRLRIGMICVSVAFVIWASLAGVWSGVAWNVAFGGVHAYQLFKLWKRHRSISLTDDERAIHRRLFAELTLVDFFTLWSIGNGRRAPAGELLIAEQSEQHTIILIVSGDVVVERHGRLVATVSRGGRRWTVRTLYVLVFNVWPLRKHRAQCW